MVTASTIVERDASWMHLFASYQLDKAVGGVEAVLRAVRDMRAGSVDAAQWREAMATSDGASAAYAKSVGLGTSLDGVRDYPARLASVRPGRRARREHVPAGRGPTRFVDESGLYTENEHSNGMCWIGKYSFSGEFLKFIGPVGCEFGRVATGRLITNRKYIFWWDMIAGKLMRACK